MKRDKYQNVSTERELVFVYYKCFISQMKKTEAWGTFKVTLSLLCMAQ